MKPSKDQYNYEAVTKVGEKYVYAYFYASDDGYTDFTYVDQNHARNKAFREYVDCGLIEAIDYLYKQQSFEKFADHLVETALGYEFLFTKADYTVNVEKTTLDGGDSSVLVTMAMTPEWCAKNLYSGMPLSSMSMGCAFSYNSKYLTGFVNTQELSVTVESFASKSLPVSSMVYTKSPTATC